MEDIIGFDEQVSGFFDNLIKRTMPKLPTVTARPSLQNTGLVLTPEEKNLILAMRAKKSGNFFNQIKKAATTPVVTKYKKRNWFGF